MNKRAASIVVVCVAMLALASLGLSYAAKPAPDAQTGVKVGEKAPAFRLKDQQGEERSLDDLLKQGKVALVFYRSADW